MFVYAPISKILFYFHIITYIYSLLVPSSTKIFHVPNSTIAILIICLPLIRLTQLEHLLGSRLYLCHFILSFALSFLLLASIPFLPIYEYIEHWIYYKSSNRSWIIFLRTIYKLSWISSICSLLFYNIRYSIKLGDKLMSWGMILALWMSGFDKHNFGIRLTVSTILGYVIHYILFNINFVFVTNIQVLNHFLFTLPSPEWFNNPQLSNRLSTSQYENIDPSTISMITDMGFTHSQAINALRNNNYDITRAMNHLLDDQE